MDSDQRLYAIGCYINSALYLFGVFVAGILFSHPVAWKLALTTAGVCFLNYAAQIQKMRQTGDGLALLSIMLGVAAGINLLIG